MRRRQVAQVRERVEEGEPRGDPRLVRALEGAARRGDRDHEVLRYPDRLEAEPVRLLGDVRPQTRVQPRQLQAEFHSARCPGAPAATDTPCRSSPNRCSNARRSTVSGGLL